MCSRAWLLALALAGCGALTANGDVPPVFMLGATVSNELDRALVDPRVIVAWYGESTGVLTQPVSFDIDLTGIRFSFDALPPEAALAAGSRTTRGRVLLYEDANADGILDGVEQPAGALQDVEIGYSEGAPPVGFIAHQEAYAPALDCEDDRCCDLTESPSKIVLDVDADPSLPRFLCDAAHAFLLAATTTCDVVRWSSTMTGPPLPLPGQRITCSADARAYRLETCAACDAPAGCAATAVLLDAGASLPGDWPCHQGP